LRLLAVRRRHVNVARHRVEITSAAAHGAVFSRFFQVGETTIYGFFEQDRVGLTLKRK
jgi:hypothetical protein